VDKAHIEHAVGFIEDERFDAAQIDEALLHEIFESAGRGDEHIKPRAERTHLRTLPNAAEDGRQMKFLLEESAIGFEAFRDLGDQFAGGVARRWSTGRAKAAVFPVPVWAQPSTSLPSITCGIACAWMGVGMV
jgi:hypothetical protein